MGRLIYTPRPHSHVHPFGSRVHPPPLQHAPVQARTRRRTYQRLDTCSCHNGCVRIAFRPHEDIMFVRSPTRLHPLTCVWARHMCARSCKCVKSLRLVPLARARHICTRIHRRGKSPHLAPCICAWNPHPFPLVHPWSTCPHPLACVRAQRGRVFTSGRTRSTAWATITCLQSFSTSAPCSHMRPQSYINLFAPLYKSLCF